jgi:hypothetical protein
LGTESSPTRRWSKPDTNSRSHLRRDPCSAANPDRSFSSIWTLMRLPRESVSAVTQGALERPGSREGPTVCRLWRKADSNSRSHLNEKPFRGRQIGSLALGDPPASLAHQAPRSAVQRWWGYSRLTSSARSALQLVRCWRTISVETDHRVRDIGFLQCGDLLGCQLHGNR